MTAKSDSPWAEDQALIASVVALAVRVWENLSTAAEGPVKVGHLMLFGIFIFSSD
jgi:hypothetical protein